MKMSKIIIKIVFILFRIMAVTASYSGLNVSGVSSEEHLLPETGTQFEGSVVILI